MYCTPRLQAPAAKETIVREKQGWRIGPKDAARRYFSVTINTRPVDNKTSGQVNTTHQNVIEDGLSSGTIWCRLCCILKCGNISSS